MTPSSTVRQLAVLAAAAAAAIVVGASPASADHITTSTGQTLRIIVSGGGLDQPQVVAWGTARISPGPAKIKAVSVLFNDSDPIPVDLDSEGHFRKGVVMAFDASSVKIEAVATATDGSRVNALVVLDQDGTVTRPASPDKTRPVRVMPSTGMSDPPVLGPIGLAMVLLGSVLVWRSRSRPA